MPEPVVGILLLAAAAKGPVLISILAALDESGLIGAGDRLPWRLRGDMRRFRRLTMGKPLLMGRRTHESIGRPLDGRTNIVLSRRVGYEAPGCRTVACFEDALALARAGNAQELMVIGGAEIYALALPAADRLYLTRVQGRFEGDVYFPPYDESQWIEEEREAGEDAQGPGYCFVTYRRRSLGPAR